MKFSLISEKNTFVQLLNKYNYQFTVGHKIVGKIRGFEKAAALVDIGAKTNAYLPLSEIFLFQSFSIKELFFINEVSEFILFSYNSKEKIIIISLKKLKSLLKWQRLKELSKENLITSSKIIKSNRQGKIVLLDGFKAFISNSHLPKYYRRKTPRKFEIPVKIIELTETKNKIFLTSKLAYFKNQISFLKVQQTAIGCISQIKPYGLFINIYGLKGLLHISEISSERITSLNTIFKKGQLINVNILYINLNRGRISLSLKH
uniref:30S ribosomal protein S1 n=1 Tax=Vacuolaria virescens TaxID=44451 RepID=UPI002113CC14|nr:30S ribosomal protein S1 [Vacuolaria virescens]UTE94747.1 30S ribosomal protein S1 [Vacuolaria virescens]